MITAADRDMVTWRLAGPATAFPVREPEALGNPVQVITTVLQLAQGFGLFTDKKAGYKSFDAASLQAVSQYGTNFIAGSQALGIDPVAVASALSDYLKDQGVNLTPQQLLAAAQPPSVLGAVQSNLPLILGAGGALLAAYLLIGGRH